MQTNEALFSHSGTLLTTLCHGEAEITSFPGGEPVHKVVVSDMPATVADLDPRGRCVVVLPLEPAESPSFSARAHALTAPSRSLATGTSPLGATTRSSRCGRRPTGPAQQRRACMSASSSLPRPRLALSLYSSSAAADGMSCFRPTATHYGRAASRTTARTSRPRPAGARSSSCVLTSSTPHPLATPVFTSRMRTR